VPYGNGRNEESSSEAVNGYDGVTLYGHQMAQVFAARGDMARANTASHIRYSTHTASLFIHIYTLF
jgi:endoglucanase Acf2